MPYWVRRAVAQLDGHHVIIGYGELGKRLASELVDTGNTVLVVDLSAQTARMMEQATPLLDSLRTILRSIRMLSSGVPRGLC